MIKEGQSILDFINFFPLQSVNVRRSPITDKEAQVVYAIWDSERDNQGNPIIPDNLDSGLITGLISKGYLEGARNIASMLESGKRSITITKKGKDIVRNIILLTESNTFDKESKKTVDYEGIHRALTEGTPAETKTASSWLQKITKQSQMGWGRGNQSNDFAEKDVRLLHSELYELRQYAENALNMMNEMKDREVESRIMADPEEGTEEIRTTVADCVIELDGSKLRTMAAIGSYLGGLSDVGQQGTGYGSDITISQ